MVANHEILTGLNTLTLHGKDNIMSKYAFSVVEEILIVFH